MSNKPHLRPHKEKRQASQITRLLMAILVIAFFVLAIALEATGHVVFRGRLILLGRGGRWLLMWWAPGVRAAGLASFFGQFKGLAFPLIEALGVGPVYVGAGDAVEGGQGVARTCAGAGPFDVYDPTKSAGYFSRRSCWSRLSSPTGSLRDRPLHSQR